MHSAMIVFLLLQFAAGSNLNGRITAAVTHEPVALTRVRLEKLGFPVQEVFARDGRVQFNNLAPGRYTVIVDAPGYETSYSEVILPDDFFALIELRAKEPPAAKPDRTTNDTVAKAGKDPFGFIKRLFGVKRRDNSTGSR